MLYKQILCLFVDWISLDEMAISTLEIGSTVFLVEELQIFEIRLVPFIIYLILEHFPNIQADRKSGAYFKSSGKYLDSSSS